MRLLLTGATGFLGRHVAAAARGHTVIRATRSGHAADAGELPMGGAPWTRAAFASALRAARPEIVVHCAGATHAGDGRATFEANTVLAAELLAAAAAHVPVPRVMLIGSAAEYGFVPEDAQPVSEARACAPRNDYAVAKHAQTLLGLAAAMRGQPVLVVRLFNPVGRGMPAGLALPSFASRVAQDKGVMRVGDLSARRDFIDVTEAARLLVALAEQATWPWPLVNLCSGQAYRLGDLLDALIAASGNVTRIETDPALVRSGDMPILVGSTARLQEFGLVPQAPRFEHLLPELLVEASRRTPLDVT